ncbi:hypothetical protein BE08_31785 [Sorangium cellulosum]|uniref:Uncharacterized protein n=1 Tax=Sorangium cellulosum TaxID=56 RepID=A0A150PQ10_SORCE|nr:hypothetical protein BE08_31785 [Sorangium cellulosum]
MELLGRTLGSAAAAEVMRREGRRLGLKDATLPLDTAYAVLDALAAMPGVIGTAASVARTELRVAAVRRRLGQRHRR